MGLPPGGLLLLPRLLLLLAAGGSGESPRGRKTDPEPPSSSSHSLCTFSTALSQPVQGLPQFSITVYLDDQAIARYDSHTRKMLPQAGWMEKAEKDDPQFWESETQEAQGQESQIRVKLERLRTLHSQQNSAGLHTWQVMYGCEVGPDGWLLRGDWLSAYDGKDFLALDRETLTWNASVPQALETKRQWQATNEAQRWKSYLEESCPEWLQKFLDYGKEAWLQRTEAPAVRLARNKGYDGWETLICRVHGFYPKEIVVTWMKDGQDQKPESHSGGVVPNSDGTYHTWLSIEVDPKERDLYRCHVEHDSLEKFLDLAWEEPAPDLGLLGIIGAILAFVVLDGAKTAFSIRQWKEGGSEAESISILRVNVGTDEAVLAYLRVAVRFLTSKLGIILLLVVALLGQLSMVGLVALITSNFGLMWAIVPFFLASVICEGTDFAFTIREWKLEGSEAEPTCDLGLIVGRIGILLVNLIHVYIIGYLTSSLGLLASIILYLLAALILTGARVGFCVKKWKEKGNKAISTSDLGLILDKGEALVTHVILLAARVTFSLKIWGKDGRRAASRSNPELILGTLLFPLAAVAILGAVVSIYMSRKPEEEGNEAESTNNLGLILGSLVIFLPTLIILGVINFFVNRQIERGHKARSTPPEGPSGRADGLQR